MEVGVGFAVQPVIHGNGRGLIQSHQLGQLGEHGCHQRIVRCGLGNGRSAHLDGGGRIDRVTPGYREVFLVGVKHVQYLG